MGYKPKQIKLRSKSKERDEAIMICDMSGVNVCGIEYKNVPSFVISSNSPTKYTECTFDKHFVNAVLFWVYPFSLQGVEVHLIGCR